jgi:hypothetical protein
MRHEPQFAVVVSEVSHPFAGLPSQSSKPGSHAETRQLPLEQSPLAFAGEQIAPHAPHAMLVFKRVSQPLAVTPSQLPKPGSHPVSEHAPAAHEAAPFGNEHGTPHAPQSVRVRIDRSHPLPGFMSQSSKPAEQVVTRQVPVEQSPLPLIGAQVLRHMPQFALLVSGVSQPLVTRESQSPQLGSHASMAHVPVSHVAVAFAGEHAVPHMPQFIVVVSGVSQPSSARPLQSPNPGMHVSTVQRPPAQPAIACGRSQTSPHAPQCVGTLSCVSHPSSTIMLQSPKPGSQVAMAQVPVSHAVVATCTPRGHIASGSPSSFMPLQSSSRPLHCSVASTWTSGLSSLQSVPIQPTPAP